MTAKIKTRVLETATTDAIAHTAKMAEWAAESAECAWKALATWAAEEAPYSSRAAPLAKASAIEAATAIRAWAKAVRAEKEEENIDV